MIWYNVTLFLIFMSLYSYSQELLLLKFLELLLNNAPLVSVTKPSSSLTIEQCALTLSMSMTLFMHKLTQEETSYKLIQSKFLTEVCVKALFTSQTKVDGLAVKLGYSERVFRNKFWVTPSRFRKFALVGSVASNYQKLTEIAENIPPMPESCQQLMR
jgi:hypothetical protein